MINWIIHQNDSLKQNINLKMNCLLNHLFTFRWQWVIFFMSDSLNQSFKWFIEMDYYLKMNGLLNHWFISFIQVAMSYCLNEWLIKSFIQMINSKSGLFKNECITESLVHFIQEAMSHCLNEWLLESFIQIIHLNSWHSFKN